MKVWESLDVYYYVGSFLNQWQTNRTVEGERGGGGGKDVRIIRIFSFAIKLAQFWRGFVQTVSSTQHEVYCTRAVQGVRARLCFAS